MRSDTWKIAAAIAAGYLIGRTRKGKLVLALAGGVMMAGRGLVVIGFDQSRLQAALTEVLGDVQRSVGTALNARAEGLTDTLRTQTAGIKDLGLDLNGDEPAEAQEDEADEDAPADTASDQGESRDEPADQDGERQPAARASRSAERGARRAGGAGRRAAQTATRGGR